MRYRGLDPRTRRLRWSLVLVALLAVLLVTGPHAVDTLSRTVGTDREALPWFATRVFAMLSYLALTVSVVYGLLLSTGILDAIAQRTVSFSLHQDLGAIGLTLGVWHAMLLAIDRSVPFSLVEIMVPFAGSYRPFWVGLGQVGLYLTAIVVASFYLRKRLGQKAWRRLHYVSFLAFVAVTAHGLMAGTDTGSTWALGGYLAAVTVVAFLLSYRVVISLARRVPQATST